MCYADQGKKIWEGGVLCEVAEDAIVSEFGTLAVVTRVTEDVERTERRVFFVLIIHRTAVSKTKAG
jgi:hypothetical protein